MKVIEADLISENTQNNTKNEKLEFNLQLIVKKKDPKTHQVSVGLDFTFNALRNVHRVGWQ